MTEGENIQVIDDLIGYPDMRITASLSLLQILLPPLTLQYNIKKGTYE